MLSLLFKNSLSLDFLFLRYHHWGFNKKLEFLFKKYFLAIKHLLLKKKYNPGKSKISLFSNNIYYDNKYGLGDYQSILVRHYCLMKLNDVDDVDVVLDVGANVGYFSLLCKDLFPNSKVISFEPIPEVFESLKKNLSVYSKTIQENVAVSDKSGFVRMSYDKDDSAISHITKCGNIKVKTIKLDDYIKKESIENIDILKIDVETFEKDVLKGAKNVLKNTKYLFIEITLENNTNYTFSELCSLLYSKDYNFQLIGFRNFSNKGMGKMPLGDFLFKNVDF